MIFWSSIVIAIGIYNAGLAIGRGIVNAERVRQGLSVGKD